MLAKRFSERSFGDNSNKILKKGSTATANFSNIAPDILDFYKNVDNLINNNTNQSFDDLITLITMQNLIGKYLNFSDEKSGNPGYLVHKAMQNITQNDLSNFLGTVKFAEKNNSMLVAVLSIMNDNLLDVVINSNSFKNEPVNLSKMLNSNNRKGIFSYMSHYLKSSLFNLSDLKNRFYLDAFEGNKLEENEFYT